MSRFDVDSSTASDARAEVVQGLRGATRIAERHEVAIKTALFFATTTVLGLVWHSTATQQFGNNMSAVLVWFSLIFAGAAGLLGGTITLWSAVQRRRHDWE